jgi:Predicted transcriptional regulators
VSAKSKAGHEQLLLGIGAIDPSPENAKLYRPPSPDDPDIVKLADDIKQNGVKEPLVISADNYIMSGHRRHCAAMVAGLTKVPCIRNNITRGDGEQPENPDEYIRIMRSYNRQRVKSSDELMREAVLDTDPEEAYQTVTTHRRKKAKVKAKTIELGDYRRRKEISPARFPLLKAAQQIIDELEDFRPLDVRQIHYQVINQPPLKHAQKPSSLYRNDKPSYHVLCDLLTRARHEGYVDYDVIDDPSRVVIVWDTYDNLGDYYRAQLDGFLISAKRNLMRSQPSHIELVVEKNTLRNTVEPMAWEFGIPLSFGRGQASTPVLSKISNRFKESGKDNLLIIAVSDLDPTGDAIARSIGLGLRDDFNHDPVKVLKAALTMEQAHELRLPVKFERAKKDDKNTPGYIERYGTDHVWELEALHPTMLQKLIRDALESVLDHKMLSAEIERAKLDAVHIAATRETVLRTLRENHVL